MQTFFLFLCLIFTIIALSFIATLWFRLSYQNFNRTKLKDLNSISILRLPIKASEYRTDAERYNKLTRITNISGIVFFAINLGGAITIYKHSPFLYILIDFIALTITLSLAVTRSMYILSMIKKGLWTIEKIPRKSFLLLLNGSEKNLLKKIYTRYLISFIIVSFSAILLAISLLYAVVFGIL